MATERRRAARTHARGLHVAFVAADGRRSDVEVSDAGPHGMFLRCDAPPPADTLLLLEIYVPAEAAPLPAFGRVVWTRAPGPGAGAAPAGMGVKLVSPDAAVTAALSRLAGVDPGEAPTTMNIVPQLVVSREVRDDALPPPRAPAASLAIDLLPKVALDLVTRKSDSAPSLPEPTRGDIPRRRGGVWVLLLLLVAAAASALYVLRDRVPLHSSGARSPGGAAGSPHVARATTCATGSAAASSVVQARSGTETRPA